MFKYNFILIFWWDGLMAKWKLYLERFGRKMFCLCWLLLGILHPEKWERVTRLLIFSGSNNRWNVPSPMTLLMEEILVSTRTMNKKSTKPYQKLDIIHINWLAGLLPSTVCWDPDRFQWWLNLLMWSKCWLRKRVGRWPHWQASFFSDGWFNH